MILTDDAGSPLLGLAGVLISGCCLSRRFSNSESMMDKKNRVYCVFFSSVNDLSETNFA